MKALVALIHFIVAALVTFDLFGAKPDELHIYFDPTQNVMIGKWNFMIVDSDYNEVLSADDMGVIYIGEGYTLETAMKRTKEILLINLCTPEDRKWKVEINNLSNRHLRCYEI